MKENAEKKTSKERKNPSAEKPVSLWGAPFKDVVKALLDTKPMPKEEEKEENAQNEGG